MNPIKAWRELGAVTSVVIKIARIMPAVLPWFRALKTAATLIKRIHDIERETPTLPGPEKRTDALGELPLGPERELWGRFVDLYVAAHHATSAASVAFTAARQHLPVIVAAIRAARS